MVIDNIHQTQIFFFFLIALVTIAQVKIAKMTVQQKWHICRKYENGTDNKNGTSTLLSLQILFYLNI